MKQIFAALIFAVFSLPSSVHSQPIVSAPSLDGALTILRIHLMENAPDTQFVIKPKKMWGIVVRNKAQVQVYMDSLRFAKVGTPISVSNAVLTVTQIIHDPTPRAFNTKVTFRKGEIAGFPYPSDSVMLYLECLSITKTQARFREYKLWLPLIQDSIAIIPRQRGPSAQFRSAPGKAQQLQRAADK